MHRPRQCLVWATRHEPWVESAGKDPEHGYRPGALLVDREAACGPGSLVGDYKNDAWGRRFGASQEQRAAGPLGLFRVGNVDRRRLPGATVSTDVRVREVGVPRVESHNASDSRVSLEQAIERPRCSRTSERDLGPIPVLSAHALAEARDIEDQDVRVPVVSSEEDACRPPISTGQTGGCSSRSSRIATS